MNKIKLWHIWHSSILFALCLFYSFPVHAQATNTQAPHCPACSAYGDFIRSLETVRNAKAARLDAATESGKTLTSKGLSGSLTPDEREALSRLRRETEQIDRELPLIDQQIAKMRESQANCSRTGCTAPSTQAATPAAACPTCESARAALSAKRAELKQKQDAIETIRKRNAETILSKDIPDLMDLIEAAENAMRTKVEEVNRLEQEAQDLQHQLETCNKGCAPPNRPLVIPGTATPIPAQGTSNTPSGQAPFTPLPPGSARAACPACESARAALADKQGELSREQNQLDTFRKNLTDVTINQDRRVPDDPEAVRARIIAVQQYEQLIRAQADKVSKLELEMQDLQRQLDACNLHCAQQPQQSGCSFPPAKPITIGPRDQFGEKSIGQQIGEKAQGMLGSMLGGMFGGAIGLARGGDDASNARPDEVPDPVKDKQLFRGVGTETALRIGAVPDPAKDGLRLSAYIEDSASKGVVHSIHRETMDQNCKVDYQMPSDYWLYEIWLEWSLTVWWSKDTYVDNQLVKHEQGGWQKEGKEMLGSGIFDASKDIPKTAWGQLGFDRAFAGPRSIGATFAGITYPSTPDIETKQQMERYVIHVSEPHLDPVITTPFAFYPKRGSDGKIAFTDQPPVYPLHRMKIGGGMQQLDPPAPQGQAPQSSILDSIEVTSGPK